MSHTPEDTATWTRKFARESNNLAWNLAEKAERTDAEAHEMLHAAHAAALHWSRVGTDLNIARAQLLLGHVYALLRQGRMAMDYAQTSFTYLTTHNAPDWELAFAHAILAHAALAYGDLELHRERYESASALGDAIAGEEEKAIFMRTFKLIPAPPDV